MNGKKKRLFLILWVPGMAGILSLLSLDIARLAEMFPLPEGQAQSEMPPIAVLKIVSLIQPAVLLTIAILIGLGLARKVGLHSPAAEAAARGEAPVPKLLAQVPAGIVVGIISGVAIVVIWVAFKPFLGDEFVAKATEFNALITPALRFLYGGITEEMLLRWGFMTLIVWGLWRLAQRGKGEPHAALFVIAIFLSAIIFGIGHLPVAFVLAGGLTFPLVAYVITANSIFGVGAGFLYWRRGLEAAIIAHMVAHVVLLLALALAL